MVSVREDIPQRGSVSELLRNLLDRGYNQAAQRTVEAIAQSTRSGIVQQRLRELDEEVTRLRESGQALTPGNPVFRALLADLESVMAINQRRVQGASSDVQRLGIDVAEIATRQLALPGISDGQLRAAGIQWNTPDPEAVQSLIEMAESDAFANLLREYGGDVIETVRNQAVKGLAFGWGSRRVSLETRKLVENLPGHLANTLLRTLQMTSYRSATSIHQNANINMIESVVRIETLDTRTCLACWGLHGTVIWQRDRDAGKPIPRVQDHHNGRGTSVTNLIGRDTRSIEAGTTQFERLTAEKQREIMGPANFAAYQAGAVRLEDYQHRYTDPVFGEMINEKSLRAILGAEQARMFYT